MQCLIIGFRLRVRSFSVLLLLCYIFLSQHIEVKSNELRSFGHQGALYYVFLTSDPLKTSCEYAVFTLRTRGQKMCTRETLRQTQWLSAFLFWMRRMIALLHTSWGKLAARTKFHNVLWKTQGLARMVTSKILCKIQKWDRSRPTCIHIFA